jgi:hypothetical protein
MEILKKFFPRFFEKDAKDPERKKRAVKRAVKTAKVEITYSIPTAEYFEGTEDGNLDIKSSKLWIN